ncbi:hypothetical protein BN1723_002716 [Verticillium longisporum]|uniref:Uncharacterized protein n=1 Tax=Verticillium longisporum TaxID=100787 RepID=A0A0G4LFN2_VERLO|nr:hypothetical protein BN1723_002716 [Verticillium longisporum]
MSSSQSPSAGTPQSQYAPSPYQAPPQASGPPPTGPPPGGPPPSAGPPPGGPPAGARPTPPPPRASAPPPARHPTGDRSHIPANAQRLVEVFSSDMQRVTSKAPASFGPQVKDTQKRLNLSQRPYSNPRAATNPLWDVVQRAWMRLGRKGLWWMFKVYSRETGWFEMPRFVAFYELGLLMCMAERMRQR